jgi:hypothetical protein
MSSDTKLFDLGCVYMTSGVNDIAEQHSAFLHFVAACIISHSHGDWGDTADPECNTQAIERGSRILSSYSIPLPFRRFGTNIWVITEADRESTTVLFPGEY